MIHQRSEKGVGHRQQEDVVPGSPSADGLLLVLASACFQDLIGHRERFEVHGHDIEAHNAPPVPKNERRFFRIPPPFCRDLGLRRCAVEEEVAEAVLLLLDGGVSTRRPTPTSRRRTQLQPETMSASKIASQWTVPSLSVISTTQPQPVPRAPRNLAITRSGEQSQVSVPSVEISKTPVSDARNPMGVSAFEGWSVSDAIGATALLMRIMFPSSSITDGFEKAGAAEVDIEDQPRAHRGFIFFEFRHLPSRGTPSRMIRFRKTTLAAPAPDRIDGDTEASGNLIDGDIEGFMREGSVHDTVFGKWSCVRRKPNSYIDSYGASGTP